MRISDWSSDVCSSDLEDLENLLPIGLGVFLDLLPRQRLACLILARRVTDHAGEIANQENRLVPLLLKRTQLIQQQRVAQMKILGGRVETSLDAKSAPFLMPLPDPDPEFFRRTDSVGAAFDFSEVLVQIGNRKGVV